MAKTKLQDGSKLKCQFPTISLSYYRLLSYFSTGPQSSRNSILWVSVIYSVCGWDAVCVEVMWKRSILPFEHSGIQPTLCYSSIGSRSLHAVSSLKVGESCTVPETPPTQFILHKLRCTALFSLLSRA